MIDTTVDGNTVIQLLTFIIGIVLPLFVGIVTTRVTSPAMKAVVLAVLSFFASLLSGILQALITQEPYSLVQNVFTLLGVFVIAVASYFGVWSRPTADGESISSKLVGKVGRTAEPDGSYSVTDVDAPRHLE